MELIRISQKLNTHEACLRYLEKKRWNGTPICPYCKSQKSSPKGLRHTCNNCSNSFSVTVDTVFHNSNLPLNKWLMAIALILSAKKGLSAMQLSRTISVNKNTAWLMQMKIRAAMKGDLDHKWMPWKTQNKKLTRRGWFTNCRPRNRSVFSFGLSSKQHLMGYWSLLKRSIIGQYHQIDEYYLPRYLDEIDFKSQARSLPDHGYEKLMCRALCNF